MKGFFRALAKPVTAPIALVRKTARLLTLRSRASDLLTTAEAAETNPALYRDANWWSRLLKQAGALLAVLPVPQEVRDMKLVQNMLMNWKTTLGGIAALAGAISTVANDPSKISDPLVLAMFGAAWAAFNAKDQNVTGGTKPATTEAALRVPEN